MKVLIVGGGDEPSGKLMVKYAKEVDKIIGVDRGCSYLLKNNIYPDYIVGDFDSSNSEIIDKIVKEDVIKYQYQCEKNFTDSEEAFELANSKGAKKIVFLGATGGRFDHTLGNLGLLLKALKLGMLSEIVDDRNKMFLINKDTVIKRDDEYKYVSFLSYNSRVEEFSIKGAKYNLDKYTLEIGDSRTVSNEFITDEISLELSNGSILVVYSKD